LSKNLVPLRKGCPFFIPLISMIIISQAKKSIDSLLLLWLITKWEMSIYPVNPVRNSSGALNPAGIILKSNPAAEQRGIISNGVKRWEIVIKYFK
jgi:hypothetical protein